MKIRSEENLPVVIELKPKRDLLDPKFNGYKLSLESLPTYTIDLEREVDKVYPTGEQYSLQHIKLFATHNHIIFDNWNPSTIFVIDSAWNILKLSIDVESGTFGPITKVWSIPATEAKIDGRYNVTLDFPNKFYGVLADGCGNVHILETGNRTETTSWKGVFHKALFEDKKWKQFQLLATADYIEEEWKLIDILVCRIDEKADWQGILKRRNESNVLEYSFVSVLEWITLSEDGNNEWGVKSSRTLVGRSGFDYCSLEGNGSAIYLASDDEYLFSTDVENISETNEAPNNVDPDADLKRHAYLWMQNNEEITIWVKLPLNATDNDVRIDVGLQKIRVHFREWLLIDGILQNKVIKDDFKWSINTAEGPSSLPLQQQNSQRGSIRYLEIIVKKQENGTWSDNLISDESYGKLLDAPPPSDEIHGTLSDLCSNRWGEDKYSSCLDSQLEDCDSFPSFTSCLMRIDREQQKITDKVSLHSHQWLFNVHIEKNKTPAICVRHDVDGVVWQPEIRQSQESDSGRKFSWELDHIGTFSAFGYVQAAKQDRKYTICPPDLSYVAICDTKKHVYVYHQPKRIENSLRNRKTGESISHVAKQQIISVDPVTEIIGVHASNDFLFILTSKRLTACRIKPLLDP